MVAQRRYILVFLSLIMNLVGCSDGTLSGGWPDANEPGQQAWGAETAIGEINGQAWQFVNGNSRVIRKGNQSFLVVRLWNERYLDPCGEQRGSGLQVRLSVPKQVDRWTISPQDPFNSTYAIFFSDREFKPGPLDNLKADRGEILIDQITKTMVSGRIRGGFSHTKVGSTQVEGSFVVPLCGDANFSRQGP